MITEKKSELEAVLNTLVDGVIMIDEMGIITRFNPASEHIFGYSREDIIGQNIKQLMPNPYKSSHDTYIQNYKNTHKPQIIGIGREVQGQRKDGTVFPMYLSVGEVADTKQTSFVGIIRDLTQEVKRRSEFEALQQQHFHLSRVSAMDQMGAAIAHELNQPLTAIMNYLDAGLTLTGREDGRLDIEKINAIMQKSSEQASRAAEILSRLRKFIETGDIEKKSTNIVDLLTTSIDLIMPLFKKDGIVLARDIKQDLPNILASRVQIQQVLVNLIKNACEAMQESQDKTLTVSAWQKQNDIVIGIIDTGCGFSDEVGKLLFEPFATTKEKGLGVGLSICQSIMGNHEGQIWTERNTPQGSKFYISLPID